MDAWFRLMAEAMRGSSDAQAALKALGATPWTPEALAGWMAQYLPLGAVPANPAAFGASLEDLWRMMGLVPRSRYLELLERYEALRTRLEEAEVTIQRLRALLEERGREGEARTVLDLWAQSVEATLQAQRAWMRTWTSPAQPGSQARDTERQAPTPSNRDPEPH